MGFTGTLANVNAAVNGLAYKGNLNYNGADSLSLTTDDQGATGSGGAKTDADAVAVTVKAVNDTPTNTVPAAQSVDEDTPLVFSSGAGNAVASSDGDAGCSPWKITL